MPFFLSTINQWNIRLIQYGCNNYARNSRSSPQHQLWEVKYRNLSRNKLTLCVHASKRPTSTALVLKCWTILRTIVKKILKIHHTRLACIKHLQEVLLTRLVFRHKRPKKSTVTLHPRKDLLMTYTLTSTSLTLTSNNLSKSTLVLKIGIWCQGMSARHGTGTTKVRQAYPDRILSLGRRIRRMYWGVINVTWCVVLTRREALSDGVCC